MARKDHVEVQKGPMEVGLPTYRTMTYPERVREREAEYRDLRSAQTQTLHEPKHGRKK